MPARMFRQIWMRPPALVRSVGIRTAGKPSLNGSNRTFTGHFQPRPAKHGSTAAEGQKTPPWQYMRRPEDDRHAAGNRVRRPGKLINSRVVVGAEPARQNGDQRRCLRGGSSDSDWQRPRYEKKRAPTETKIGTRARAEYVS